MGVGVLRWGGVADREAELEFGGDDDPGDAQAGSHRLAGGSGVEDAVVGQPLQGVHGLTVVAELAVVVVLDDEGPAALGPRQQLRAARRAQRDAERVLVGGGHRDGGLASETVDHQPLLVHRDVAHGEPHLLRQGGVAGLTGVLKGEGRRPLQAERLADEPEGMGVPGADEHAVGPGHHAPGTAEVVRQRLPEIVVSGRVAVAEREVGRGLHHLPGGGEPLAARERRQVRHPGAQIRRRRRGGGGRRRCGCGGRRGGPVGHPDPRAGPGRQVPLGDQLVIGLGDGAARDAQVTGEHPGGGQGRPRHAPHRHGRRPHDLPPRPARRNTARHPGDGAPVATATTS
jgi:hypothetical protein